MPVFRRRRSLRAGQPSVASRGATERHPALQRGSPAAARQLDLQAPGLVARRSTNGSGVRSADSSRARSRARRTTGRSTRTSAPTWPSSARASTTPRPCRERGGAAPASGRPDDPGRRTVGEHRWAAPGLSVSGFPERRVSGPAPTHAMRDRAPEGPSSPRRRSAALGRPAGPATVAHRLAGPDPGRRGPVGHRRRRRGRRSGLGVGPGSTPPPASSKGGCSSR